MKHFLTLLLVMSVQTAFAQSKGISFQALVKDTSGQALNVSNITINAKILAPNGCILRDENFLSQNIVDGYISLSLTNGIAGGVDPTLTLRSVFDNTATKSPLVCINTDGTVNGVLTSYVPSSGDARKVRISFANGADTVVADFNLRSVPFASNSDSLNGKTSSEFVNINTGSGVSQANVESIFNRYSKLDSILNNFNAAGAIFNGTISSSNVSGLNSLATASLSPVVGQTVKWDGSAWVVSNDNSGGAVSITSADVTSALGYTPVNASTAVTSVAGRTGAVTLSSSDISGLGSAAGLNVGTAAGTVAAGDDARFTDTRTPTDNSVTSAKIVDGTIVSADLSNGSVESSKLAQMGASSGQVMKWNGSSWVASDDATGGGGSVTSVTASGPLSSSGGATPNITMTKANGTTDGYLSSADWSLFNAKLSDFTSLTSADITSKLGYTPLSNFGSMTSSDVTSALGYTPVNASTAVTSVAGRTGAVTLSSSDISGLGALAGKSSISSSDLSNGSVESSKLAQMGASSGQVMKWNGSSWVASDDATGGGGSVTSVTASGPLSSSGGATPNITMTKANGTTDGYLSSSDWSLFNAKLSDFTSLTSADITSKLGYTPLANFGSMTSSDVTTALGYTPVNPTALASYLQLTGGTLSGNLNLGGNKLLNVKNAASVSNDPTVAEDGKTLRWNNTASQWEWFTPGVAGAGITTFNGESGASQSFAVNNGGTFGFTSSSNVHTLNIPTASGSAKGLLSSSDWTTFNSKLSNFSTLTSADITGKLGYTPLSNFGSMTSSDVTSALGYTPVNASTAVTSVAGRTGAVTLSSSDISGLGSAAGLNVGTAAGTVAAGDDARFTDTRTPTDNSVTSAKIVDGTIVSADLSNGSVESSKLAQMGASSGQVMKWNGSSWVASDDATGGGGSVTSVTASGPLSSSGGATPNITMTKANGTTDGYLSSADWSLFNAKLSDFTSLTSADITGKLGYTPLANFGSMTSSDVTSALGYIPANVGSVILASQMPSNCGAGQTLTFSSPTGSWVCSNIVLASNSVTSSMVSSLDWSKIVNTPSTLAGYGVTLVSSDITSGLGYTPLSPTTVMSGDISGVYNNITVNRIKNIPVVLSSLSSGDIVQYNGSSFVNRNIPSCGVNQYLTFDGTSYSCVTDVGAGGTVGSVNSLTGALSIVAGTSGTNFNIDSTGTTITLNMPTASSSNRGLLSSADWTVFNSKLSNFSTLTSADITGKLGYTPLANFGSMTSSDVTGALGYTPVNASTAVTSVAGRTGAVTLSSSDISGLGSAAGLNVGIAAGTVAAGDDARFTDTRTPTDNSVTSAKIVDGTIVSADLSNGSVESSKLAQMGASSGQVMKWNGSSWVASDDATGGGGSVTSVTASGPLSSSGGATPNITMTKANGTTDGYLSSADWTVFNSKLSNFSTLTSADITGKLGYTPLANFGSMTSSDVTTSLGYTPVNPTALSAYLQLTGGTLSGNLNLGGNKLLNVKNVASVSNDPTVLEDGKTLRWNNTASQWEWFTPGVAGAGITTLNGESGSSQSFAVNNGGTFGFTSSSNVHTLNIPTASGSAKGLLSSADWSTFNSKLSNFSTLTSADVTAKYGYTPVNPASLAGSATTDTTNASNITSGTLAAGRLPAFTGDVTTSAGSSATTIATDAVTTTKIINNAVTAAKLESGTNGQLFIGNGTGFTKATLTGTANQVSVANGSGTITLSTPQNIHTAASPTFAGMTLSGITGNTLLRANASGVMANATSADITGLLGFTPVSNAAVIAAANGGTGQSTYTVGDMLYASGATALSKLSAGTSGYVLTSNGAGVAPSWQAVSGSGTVNSGTINKMAFYSATGTAVSSNANVTMSNGVMTLGQAGSVIGGLGLSGSTSGTVSINPQAAAGTYNFNLPTSAGTSGQVLTSGGGVGAAMTWTTLAGSATTDTTNASNITSGTLAAGRLPAFTGDVTTSAGSSATTIATDAVTTTKIINNAVTAAKLESGTNGQLFIGNGTGFTKATLTGTANQVSVANGSGTITLSTPQNIHTAASPTFAGMTLSGITGNTLLRANASGVMANATSADITGLLGFTPVSNAAVIAAANGGTGQSTYTVGDMLYASGATALSKLSAGTSGYVLTSNGAGVAPSWQAVSGSGTVNSGTTNKLAYYTGATAVSSNANMTVSSGALTLGTAGSALGSLLVTGSTSGTVTIQPQAAAGTYNFNLPTTAGTSGQVLTSGGGVGAAMTWTTLAGSATTDTTNASNITSGTLAAGRLPAFTGDVTTSAGSSATTIATDAVTTTKIINNAVTAAKLESGTNGQLFIGNGTGFTKATLTGTANQVSVANGSGTITLSTPQNIHTAASPTFAGMTLSGITGNTLLRANASGVMANATSADITGLLGFTPGTGSVNSGTLNALAYYSGSTTLSSYPSVLVSSGSLYLGSIGSVLGTISVSGSSSGTITIQPQATAGTYNFNLPTTAGTSGQVLTSGGGAGSPMTWTTLAGSATTDTTNASNITSGTLAVARGGTGQSTYTVGDMLYASGATALSKLSAGTSGYVLTSNGAGVAPSWQAVSGSGTVNSGTINKMAFYSATGTAVSSNANVTMSNGVMTLGQAGSVIGGLGLSGSTSGTVTIQPQAAAGTYNFNLPTTAGTSGQVLTSGGGVGAAMTWTTLAGSATTDTTNASNITSGTLAAGRLPAFTGDVTTSAGSSATTIATDAVTTTKIINNAVTAAKLESGSNGQLFIGNGTGFTKATLTGTANQVTVTNGSGTITLSTPQNIGTASSPTFTGMTLSGLTNGIVKSTTGVLSGGNSVALASEVSGTLPAANGGTGQSTYTVGDMLYASGATALSKLAAGTSGYVLTSNGAGVAPSWQAVSGSGTVNSGTINKMAFYSATGTAVSSNANVTMSNGVMTLGQAGSVIGGLGLSGSTSGTVSINPQAAAGTYNFNLPTTAGTSGQVLTSGGGVGAAMTWTTLAGSATTDTTNASNITSGTLAAGRLPAFTGDVTTSAGSSATTIAANAVTSAKILDGTIASADLSSASVTAAKLESGSNGQLFIGNGTGFTKATLTGTANQVSVANAAGSITLSTPQNIATTSSPTFAGLTLSGPVTATAALTLAAGGSDQDVTLTPSGLLGVVNVGNRLLFNRDGGGYSWIGARGSAAEASRTAFGFTSAATTGVVSSLLFTTNGSTRASIDSAGAFQVDGGTIKSLTDFSFQNGSTGSRLTAFRLKGDGTSKFLVDGTSTGSETNTYDFEFKANSASQKTFGVYNSGAGAAAIGARSGSNVGSLDVNSSIVNVVANTSSLGFWSNGSQRMMINTSGNVAIGTSLSPSYRFDVQTATSSDGIVLRNSTNLVGALTGATAANDGGTLSLYNSGTKGTQITANSGSINYINNGGNFAIGATSASYKLDVVGDINTSTGYRAAGTCVAGTCSSDIRVKKDIQNFNYGLEELLKINVHRFKYNGLAGTENNIEDVGYIAQEVEKVIPEFVKPKSVKLHSSDETMTEIKTVNYSRFIYVVINSVKELYKKWNDDSEKIHRQLASVQTEISEKDQKIKEIEKKNAELEKQNKDLEMRLRKIEEALNKK